MTLTLSAELRLNHCGNNGAVTVEHINSFELGQDGRYRTNVWEYRAASQTDLQLHPTVKPALMIADAMRDFSGRGDIVLDLFGGSGSTLIAAEKTGRRGYLCEIDPAYCDIILARWEALSKDEAVCLGSLEAVDQTDVETGDDDA
jgi:DNA modification methylase